MKPRKILRIARWEVTKNAGGVDRRTLAVVALAIALLVVVAPIVAFGGVGLDDGLYRVSVDEASPYHDVIESDDTFLIIEEADQRDLNEGEIELFIRGTQVAAAPSPKGEAAYEELRDAVIRYNNLQLHQEANQSAAFPVEVILEFRTQPATPDPGDETLETFEPGDGEPGEGEDDANGDTSPEEPDTDDQDSDEADTDDPGDEQDSEAESPGDTETDEDGEVADLDGETTTDEQIVADGDGGPIGGIGTPFSDDAVTGSPADIDPPFPFQSLILAFLFVIPLNFLIQAYGSTILSERINRRGELLLVAPVSRFDIIAGKTVPYFVGGLLVEAALAVGLIYFVRGELGGIISIIALTPLVLLFLAATFLGAMFARSFKELTFVTVTITVGLTTYAFVPAIFTDVDQIAIISPLTLVVRELQAEAITLSEIVFSVLPPLLVAGILFGLGAGLYREEDMFDQRSIPGRVLDSLAGPITKRWHVGLMTALLIPFVFVIQLMAIALFFALGGFTFGVAGGAVPLSIILMLVVVAVSEELAKSLHMYAAYDHRRFDTSLKTGLVLGFISGTAFFIAEKIAVLGQLVGLGELEIGESFLLIGGAVTDPSVGVLFLLPFLLHVVTAGISALGARRGKEQYIVAVSLAMIVHFCYNLTVVILFVT